MLKRIAGLTAAALIAAAAGYGVSRIDGSTPATGEAPHYAFSSERVPFAPTPDFGFEARTTFGNCRPWPDGRSSISLAAVESAVSTCHPLLDGERAGLFTSPMHGREFASGSASLTSDVRFARLDPVRHRIDVGPVLMEYGDYSGGARPSLASYRGSLWLFDFETERGPEVLRISAATGAVLQRTVMPAISRPTITANAAGFWMGPAGNSLYPDHPSPQLCVWLAPLGASRGVLLHRSSAFMSVDSLTAHGTTMVADVTSLGGFSVTPIADRWTFTPTAA